MNHEEAKKQVDDIFCEIKNVRSLAELQNIERCFGKNQMNSDTYPRINFKIGKEDVDKLIADELLDEGLNLSNKISERISDPLTKILYSLAWKNGDLKKIRHILNGIYHGSQKMPDEALVFYQFGKYLTKENNEPIIDQHVIRAFKLYKCNNPDEFEKCRKLSVITKENRSDIEEYRNWLISDELKPELKKENLLII